MTNISRRFFVSVLGCAACITLATGCSSSNDKTTYQWPWNLDFVLHADEASQHDWCWIEFQGQEEVQSETNAGFLVPYTAGTSVLTLNDILVDGIFCRSHADFAQVAQSIPRERLKQSINSMGLDPHAQQVFIPAPMPAVEPTDDDYSFSGEWIKDGHFIRVCDAAQYPQGFVVPPTSGEDPFELNGALMTGAYIRTTSMIHKYPNIMRWKSDGSLYQLH